MNQLKPINLFLLIASIIGFLLINIPFLYIAFLEREVYQEAMSNGMALVFMGEAFFLMFLVSFLIFKLEYKNPGWFMFIVFSLLGSMAFSVPFFLYLHSRKGIGKQVAGGDSVR